MCWPPTCAVRSEYSLLVSPMNRDVWFWAITPVDMRRTSDDLPKPLSANTKVMGALINPASSNQTIGSKPTSSPVMACAPSGVPSIGADAPIENGHRPAAWVEVARHSGIRAIDRIRPPPHPEKPRPPDAGIGRSKPPNSVTRSIESRRARISRRSAARARRPFQPGSSAAWLSSCQARSVRILTPPIRTNAGEVSLASGSMSLSGSRSAVCTPAPAWAGASSVLWRPVRVTRVGLSQECGRKPGQAEILELVEAYSGRMIPIPREPAKAASW